MVCLSRARLDSAEPLLEFLPCVFLGMTLAVGWTAEVEFPIAKSFKVDLVELAVEGLEILQKLCFVVKCRCHENL